MADFLLTIKKPKKHYVIISGFLGLMIFSLSIIFLSGHILNVQTIYEWGKYYPIAPYTAVCLILLGLTIILISVYRSFVENIDILKTLPILVSICILIGTGIYWQALKTKEYHIAISQLISDITIYIGIVLAILGGLTLRFAITAQRKALVASNEAAKNKAALSLIKATLESTTDGILVVDKKGQAVSFNQQFLTMWGISNNLAKKGHDKYLLNYAGKQLQNAEAFFRKVKELYKHPEAESFDELYFKDGKIFERYSRPQRIENKVIGRVWSFRDVTARRQLEKQLTQQATHDSLTQLPNRNLLMDRIQQAIDSAKHSKSFLAILFIGLDKFKRINDSFGHSIGDTLLQQTAKNLSAHTRNRDTLARFSDDEFVAVISDLKQEADGIFLVQRYMNLISKKYKIENHNFTMSGSIGISIFPKDGKEPELLLRNANAAMASAKLKGGNQFQFYTEQLNTQMVERMELENELRNALEKNEFILHYQPFIDLKNGEVKGVEALVRWKHPTKGFISPQQFIPIAEETDLILPLGKWILEAACNQLKQWQDKNLNIRIAVNLSAKQFKQPGLEKLLKNFLQELQLPPEGLELELTESITLENSRKTIAKLAAIADLGISLSIDDFGTGYSNLSYLKRFPIQALKIDQAFVTDIDSNQDNAAIVKAIISMAKSLQLKVIAEGIKTNTQLQFLKQNHCDEGQGFYFSKPLDPQECEKILQKRFVL